MRPGRRASGEVGCVNGRGVPSEWERSAGPTNRTSPPSVAAIASTSRSAPGDSIWTIPTSSSFTDRISAWPSVPSLPPRVLRATPRRPAGGGRRNGIAPAAPPPAGGGAVLHVDAAPVISGSSGDLGRERRGEVGPGAEERLAVEDPAADGVASGVGHETD